MNEEQILKDLINKLDDQIEPDKLWLEWTTDLAISVLVKEGYKILDKKGLGDDFLQLAEAYNSAVINNLIQESADMLAAIFILIVTKNKEVAMNMIKPATKAKYKVG